ncbi:LPXTG cell wall anchor domain-containing protein [Evansella cellulosilytica]|uniref:LPXTG-motif cell wall anchor domain protein n=1 Tax=Evansella cellulosilytica (strain ATCC 21833 / DSM 2522 / FERM P-1141 / JCM 9156 / N-4) TaxID=649639 RepID=E6TV08_EVAC2|nr:LPXTG cell wall anchor domain-containing protein [Evansella cellulosilytica]ADU28591.1 LPXTG-motif cell wall anchor domain protein [Evansella cellulosilytica DSM 2522]
MQRKMKIVFVATTGFLVALLFIMSVQYNNRTFADSNPVNITTTPHSVLFEVDNMKPGDWADRQLTIQNRGDVDFTYHMEVEKTSGSDKLYHGLALEVYDGSELLYEGSLGGFTGFEPRYLEALHEEDFLLTVRFPTELGNDYQGLDAEVEFTFIAEEVINGTEDDEDTEQRRIDDASLEKEPQEGDILPTTATNTYNYLLIGIIALIAGIAFFLWSRKKKMKIDS